MSKKEFFPPRPSVNPTIYAYELPNDSKRKGQIKIGFTDRDAHTRIKEQIGATRAALKLCLKKVPCGQTEAVLPTKRFTPYCEKTK
jgi:hypothetical protein